MRFLTLFSINFFLLNYCLLAQSVDQLVEEGKQIYSASISPDDRLLGIHTTNEELRIITTDELQERKKINAILPSEMLWYRTGKKTFHFTGSNEILYLSRKITADSLELFLMKSDMDNHTDSVRILTIAKSSFWDVDQIDRYRWNYSLDGNNENLVVSVASSVYLFAVGSHLELLEKRKYETEIDAVALGEKQMALLSNDTVTIHSTDNWKIKLQVADSSVLSLCFRDPNHLLMAGEKSSKTLDLTTRNVESGVQFPYETYGIRIKNGMYSFSGTNSGIPQKSYGAVFKDGELSGIQHLPKSNGIINLYQSSSNELWSIFSDGKLFKLSLDPMPPRPVLQLGHRGQIEHFAVSDDKRFLLSSAGDYSVVLWDVYNGTVLDRYLTEETLLDGAYFAENQRDIYYSAGKSDAMKIHTRIPSNVLWGLANNVYLQEEDREVVQRRKQQENQQKSVLNALKNKYDIRPEEPSAHSPTYLAGIVKENYRDKLRMVHLATSQIEDIELPDSLSYYSSALRFYDDNTLLLEGKGSTILLFDCSSKKILRRLGNIPEEGRGMFSGVQKLLFSPSGDTLFTVHNQLMIQGWNLRKGERFYQFNQDNLGTDQSMFLDYAKGHLSHVIKTNNDLQFLGILHLQSDSIKLLAYLDTTLTIRDKHVTLSSQKAPGLPSKSKMSKNADSLLVLRIHYPEPGTMEAYLDLWDLQKMKRISQVPAGAFSTIPSWEVSNDLKHVLLWDHNATSLKEQRRLEKSGFQNIAGQGTSAMIYEIFLEKGKVKTHSMDKLSITRLGPEDIRFVDDKIWLRDDYETIITILQKKSWKLTDTISGTLRRYGRFQDPFLIDADRDVIHARSFDAFKSAMTIEAYSRENDMTTGRSYTHGAGIQTFSNLAGNGTFAVGLSDHSISIRSSESLKEKYRIILNEKQEYLLLAPGGYYKSNRTAAKNLFFNWNNKTYSFEQFDLWYNRPDIVLSATGFYDSSMQVLLHKAYKKRMNQYHVQPLDSVLNLNIPEMEILNFNQIPLQTDRETLELKLGLKSSGTIESIEVKINGVLTNAIPVADTGTVEKQINVQLTAGENRISIRVINSDGLYSMPGEVNTYCTRKPGNSKTHVIAVAIGEYQNKALNLTYPVKDARDIISMFSSSGQKIEVDTLFNEGVIRENVLKLQEKLANTSIDDRVILFFAGHGMLDNNFDFRFATHDIDEKEPEARGVLYDEIEEMLANTPARNKLLLIDACHSGKVDKDEVLKTGNQYLSRSNPDKKIRSMSFTNVHKNLFQMNLIDTRGFELMEDLFYDIGSSSGAQVIVATAGNSFALESPEWQNGVFTYALINGIMSHAADLDFNNKITVDEMEAYLQQEVSQLTGGAQKPRFRAENPLNKFVLWKY